MKLRQIGSNQTEVTVNKANAKPLADFPTDLTILFSYQTPVAVFVSGVGAFHTSKQWSPTTSKHINKWVKDNGFVSCPEVEQSILDNLCAEVR